MSDLETLLERELIARTEGVEAHADLFERAQQALARRRRRQRLQAVVGSVVVVAVVISSAALIASRPDHNQRLGGIGLGSQPTVRIIAANPKPFFTPQLVRVATERPFNLTIRNNLYTLDGHKGVPLRGAGIVLARYYPQGVPRATGPGPAIQAFNSKHDVFDAPDVTIPAGTSRTFQVPGLSAGRYVIYSGPFFASTTLIVEPSTPPTPSVGDRRQNAAQAVLGQRFSLTDSRHPQFPGKRFDAATTIEQWKAGNGDIAGITWQPDNHTMEVEAHPNMRTASGNRYRIEHGRNGLAQIFMFGHGHVVLYSRADPHVSPKHRLPNGRLISDAPNDHTLIEQASQLLAAY